MVELSLYDATPMPAPLAAAARFMAVLGFDPSDIVSGTELSARDLSDPAASVTGVQELRVYANMLRTSGDPALGLRMGIASTVNELGMFGALLSNAANLEQAAYLSRRFGLLSCRWLEPELLGMTADDHWVVRYRPTMDLGECHRFIVDRNLVGTSYLMRDLFGADAVQFIRSVALGYPRPPEASAYRDAIGCPVSFGHSESRVVFGGITAVNPNASAFARHLFEGHCATELNRFYPASWRQRVINALACRSDYPAIYEMARQLGCSERTLRRHLEREGRSYAALVDAMRARRADYLLRSSRRSIAQIAEQLGYSEPSAFHHAFRRWHGVSPRDYRLSHRNARPAAK